MNNKLIVVTGPTAVGKTELCIDIARHFNTPVINADSRQIYRDMTIGTAAPTPQQMAAAVHYNVGILNINEYFSASLYEQMVMTQLDDIFSRQTTTPNGNKVALLSGGSMMYIDAVCNGIDDIPTVRDDIREDLKRRLSQEGLQPLLDQLSKLDPEYYNIVDRHNYRRVVHALEICIQTGNTYTSFRTNAPKERPFDIIKIGLNRDRVELYQRINRRVDMMMEMGFLDEVYRLLPYRHCNSLNTVGYKELLNYLDGLITLDQAVEQIKSNTRRYARKQLTWYRRDESIKWFKPDHNKEIMTYLSQL